MPYIRGKFLPYSEYLESDEWQLKRRMALKAAGYRCRVCNAKAKLYSHHRTYASIGTPEEVDDIISLCQRCHDVYHQVLKSDLAKQVGAKTPVESTVKEEKDLTLISGLPSDHGDIPNKLPSIELPEYVKISEWLSNRLSTYPAGLRWLRSQGALVFWWDDFKLFITEQEIRERILAIMFKENLSTLNELVEALKVVSCDTPSSFCSRMKSFPQFTTPSLKEVLSHEP